MDTFIDKLAQKRNAQGMINANAAAEAAKMERLQNRMAEYDVLLQEMRRINLRTAENVDQARKALREGLEKIYAIQESSNMQADKEELLAAAQKQTEELLAEIRKQTTELLKETEKQSETLLADSKERSDTLAEEMKNRLDSFLAETERQSKELLAETKMQSEALFVGTKRQSEMLLSEIRQQLETLLTETQKQPEAILTEMGKQLEESFRQSDDFLHKENVKVYRNVQAAVTEELNKQTEAMAAKQQESAGKQKAMLPVSIVIMLLVAADIIINLFNITLF